GPINLIREAREALAGYFTYRAPISGAPGVWIPSASFKRRLFTASGVATVLYTTVALAVLRAHSSAPGFIANVFLVPATVLLSNAVLLLMLSKTLAATEELRRKIQRVADHD